MYNHNKAQQSKNRVHISWDILYETVAACGLQVDRGRPGGLCNAYGAGPMFGWGSWGHKYWFTQRAKNW